MPRLTKTQTRALERMFTSQWIAEPSGAFGRGIGAKTLESLVYLGLADHLTDRHGELGYAITERGKQALGEGQY